MIRLTSKLREGFWNGLIALLYSAGLTLTILHITDLMAHAVTAMLILSAMTAAMTAAAFDKRAAWAVTLTAAASALLWLALGGFSDTMEVLRALILHSTGLTIVLPLVAKETVALVSLLCGGAAFFVTRRPAGPYPALVLLLMTVVLLWLGNKVQTLWYLLPAVIATVAMMMLGKHDIRPGRIMALSAAAVLLSFSVLLTDGLEIAPLKNAADRLRQRIYDMFFFTAPRDVFSLADVGYYPQGEGQLGGPANPTKETIMAVVTPRKVYLRGAIMNVYTGRSWEDSTESKRYLWDGVRFRNIRSDTFDMQLPAMTGEDFGSLLQNTAVTVRMLGSGASTMFVPQRIRNLEAKGDVVAYFNVGSEIFATRDLQKGDEWTAEAPLMVAGEAGVRELVENCAFSADPRWEEISRTYRALPNHMEQEIYDIAWGAIAGAETPYERALAIQNYLRQNYAYTLDAPQQMPELDFVSTFLLLDKQGYCVHFASAMTVLCRMAGLPARYVEGFVATPDQTGLALVTGEEGHAWTEVYFKGYGWLTFDATPGMEMEVLVPEEQGNAGAEDAAGTLPEVPPTPAPAQDEPSPSPELPSPTPPAEAATDVPETDQPVPTREPEEPAPSADPGTAAIRPQTVRRFPWWVLAVILIPVLIIGRILWTIPEWKASRQKKESARWLVWVQACHDALRRLGLQRLPDESPMAFLARAQTSVQIPKALSRLAREESLMFYGHVEPAPENTARVRKTYEAIRKQMNLWQKICLVFERAALLRRSRDLTMR